MTGGLSPDRWRHAMKNQLGIVLGFSELLLQDIEPDDPRRADVEEILAAAGRALELMSQSQEGSTDAEAT